MRLLPRFAWIVVGAVLLPTAAIASKRAVKTDRPVVKVKPKSTPSRPPAQVSNPSPPKPPVHQPVHHVQPSIPREPSPPVGKPVVRPPAPDPPKNDDVYLVVQDHTCYGSCFRCEPAPTPPVMWTPRTAIDWSYGATCVLSALDEMIAWRVVWATGARFFDVVREYDRGGSWQYVIDRLALWTDIERDPILSRWFASSEVVVEEAEAFLGGCDLPEPSCTARLRRSGWPEDTLAVDVFIAEELAYHTGLDVDDLLKARGLLHDWGRVAKSIRLSPFVFEGLFGVLPKVADGWFDCDVQYPQDDEIVRAARRWQARTDVSWR